MNKAIPGVGVVMLAVLALVAQAQTATPVTTKVELEELDCMGCAKKIAKEIHKVAGVAEVRVDLKAKTMFVVHKPSQTPSPRAVWEAIEQADHTPVKMETPTTTHTKKPKA